MSMDKAHTNRPPRLGRIARPGRHDIKAMRHVRYRVSVLFGGVPVDLARTACIMDLRCGKWKHAIVCEAGRDGEVTMPGDICDIMRKAKAKRATYTLTIISDGERRVILKGRIEA